SWTPARNVPPRFGVAASTCRDQRRFAAGTERPAASAPSMNRRRETRWRTAPFASFDKSTSHEDDDDISLLPCCLSDRQARKACRCPHWPEPPLFEAEMILELRPLDLERGDHLVGGA